MNDRINSGGGGDGGRVPICKLRCARGGDLCSDLINFNIFVTRRRSRIHAYDEIVPFFL